MELNEKINNLNLISLRKYACAKVANEIEWFLKCLECPGLEECTCGRRVRDILDEQTNPEKTVKTRDDIFKESLEQENPIRWLVDQKVYGSNGSASNALRVWLNKTNYLSEQERKQLQHRQYSNSGKAAAKLSVQKAMDHVRSIFSGKNTDLEKRLALLDDAPDMTCKTLYNNVIRWGKSYPELEEELRFVEPCRIFGVRVNMFKTAREMKEELMKEWTEKAAMDGDTDGDEVSVMDFLKEMAPEIGKESNRLTQIVELDKPIYAEKRNADQPPLVSPSSSQLIMQDAFGRKKQELRKRFGYISGEIKKLEEEKDRINLQMQALDATAELFGMRPKA